jgi:hypothetical protein
VSGEHVTGVVVSVVMMVVMTVIKDVAYERTSDGAVNAIS